MGYIAKVSITSWWILALMSLFLWYRNEKYDRALSVFVFTLGLIELIEYGIHSGSDPSQSKRAIFITLWLQCLVLAIGVFIFTKTHGDSNNFYQKIAFDLAGWNLFLFTIFFVVALILSYVSGYSFLSLSNNNMELRTDNNSSSNNWMWLYLLGLFIPLLIIFLFYSFSDYGIAIMIIYSIFSAICLSLNLQSETFTSVFSYLAVGFAFLAWFIGVIPNNLTINSK